MVDTLVLLLVVMVTAASVQDRDAGCDVLAKLRAALPGIRLIWADGRYAGKLVDWAKAGLALALDIVRKRDGQRLRRAAPPLGRTHAVLDHQLSAVGLRLRAHDRTL